MKRVLIIGCGGAGKSTLARSLSARTGLPVVHLDRLFWKPGWVSASREEFDAILAPLLASERWIMDGNYGHTLPMRLAAADTVVLLDLPTITCMLGILKRRFAHRGGRTRVDMNEGCAERLDWEFVRWVWRFRRDSRPGLIEKIAAGAAGKNVVVLKSRAEIEQWLSKRTVGA